MHLHLLVIVSLVAGEAELLVSMVEAIGEPESKTAMIRPVHRKRVFYTINIVNSFSSLNTYEYDIFVWPSVCCIGFDAFLAAFAFGLRRTIVSKVSVSVDVIYLFYFCRNTIPSFLIA